MFGRYAVGPGVCETIRSPRGTLKNDPMECMSLPQDGVILKSELSKSITRLARQCRGKSSLPVLGYCQVYVEQKKTAITPPLHNWCNEGDKAQYCPFRRNQQVSVLMDFRFVGPGRCALKCWSVRKCAGRVP